MIKICGKCKINPRKNFGKDRYCLKCHRDYVKEWRKTHPLNEEQKKRDIARSYAYVYLKRGKLKKEPCTTCGDKKSQMHHPDYNFPLDVIWLCRKCHLKIHAD